jgi:hypothetical protein
MPEGFEFTESLTGGVSVSRIDPRAASATLADVAFVRAELDRHRHLQAWLVATEARNIVVLRPLGKTSTDPVLKFISNPGDRTTYQTSHDLPDLTRAPLRQRRLAALPPRSWPVAGAHREVSAAPRDRQLRRAVVADGQRGRIEREQGATEMGKKRHPSDDTNRSKRPPKTAPTGKDRKLSELLKELAMRLLKNPDAAPSREAVEAALLLAVAAWNDASGDPGVRRKHREMLTKYDWSDRSPWPELLATDTELLIAGLVEYKRAHYSDDRRRIVAFGMTPEATIQVQWLDPDRSPPSTDEPAWAQASCEEVEGHPIADKLLAAFKQARGRKVINLKSVAAGRATAAELQKTIASDEVLADLHPAHALYVLAQNHASILSEQLTSLNELAPLSEIISKIEDTYGSDGPPISPLTRSYFTCWALFDACTGPGRETLGTSLLALAATLGMDPELQRIIGLMQRSRMGIHAHQGMEGDLVVLRELVTGLVCHAVVPSGYRGHRGELWYARVLPPPLPVATEHVVMTTPYVLHRPGLPEWLAYFRRLLPAEPLHARLDAYARHMKHGPTSTHWPDFVFEGYLDHEVSVIRLSGLPDVPASRPHSPVNERRSWA